MTINAKEMARVFRAAAEGAKPFMGDGGSMQISDYEAARTLSRVFGAIASVYEGIAEVECNSDGIKSGN